MSPADPHEPHDPLGEPLPPRPTRADPWGHEAGEDATHQLDASGHSPHYQEPVVVPLSQVVVASTGWRARLKRRT